MLEQRIQQQFFESADLLYQAAEPLARPLDAAAQALLGCITGGGKLLVAGGALARLFAALCVRGFERERPPLAAVAIDDQAMVGALQALGAPGDVLLLLAAPGDDESELRRVVREAHDKEMVVVALGPAAAGWHDALAETDVWIAVPHERAARVRELQLLMLHALADAVDMQLMGELEAS
jgi:D-sedoheptulose 7-phosphate isomerase